MIIVTGGNGFIGTHLIERLVSKGHQVLAVNGDHGTKNCPATWSISKKDFLEPLCCYTQENFFKKLAEKGVNPEYSIEAIVHLGACSDTTCDNWEYLSINNYEYSTLINDFCRWSHTPFIYASSAAVYGRVKNRESSDDTIPSHRLFPLNKYGWSKLLVDHYTESSCKINWPINFRWYGLRFFNVYGYHEEHKGRMASMVWKFMKQGLSKKPIMVFAEEVFRDFVYVEDVVDAIWYLVFNPLIESGIYNIGSGKATNVFDVANAVAKITDGKVNQMLFPPDLVGKYQYYTQANISKLHKQGFIKEPIPLEKSLAEMAKRFSEETSEEPNDGMER
jgi:ADP-L-glycero-D-manno-heptose 6-epimerase